MDNIYLLIVEDLMIKIRFILIFLIYIDMCSHFIRYKFLLYLTFICNKWYIIWFNNDVLGLQNFVIEFS